MKLYEYMGKELLARYGIPVPEGGVAATPEEAAELTGKIGSVVIKAQILSGKRGKAGGIIFTDNHAEAGRFSADLLGSELNGYKVEAVLVEKKLQIERELYLAITVDSAARNPLILASAKGGIDIEDVPEEELVKMALDVTVGMQPFVTREVTRRLAVSDVVAAQIADILSKLYRLFVEMDAELAEINPLVISGETVIAADAKITIDDDALFRQSALPLVEERTAAEKKAHELGLSYVELDGDIAVMANGAGITMATLDLIQYYGGAAANFLDAGGGAGVEQTARALELLLSKNPRAILINIFGGITRCDDVAQAFVDVKKNSGIPVPVVIRLVGTNEEKGREILLAEGINAYKLMHEAAQRAVEIVKGN
ncbi:MAG: ADP-forming succinate--CoA ligase subunit beta [Dethiobacter sp.]|nr:ADP-forming succinate--CoA ligase subunit beta [Dethiobacter sp.]MBS3900918.1 ADP-forming succinate--CoA ligase subunit beta [Dethiobacter sp.]MBS3989958.1 ADP-forming succinate--CoA ligase subunit beta [Dethiobacter sp.]